MIGVGASFGNAIGLAGVHQDETEVGGERRIVGVDGVERERAGGRQMNDLGSGVGKQAAERFMLSLGGSEFRRVVKSEIAPGGGLVGAIPDGAARRTDHDAEKIAGHRLDLCLRL